MPELTDLERDLNLIASEMRRLEGEYNMYFAGRTPRPPVETRARLDALLKKWERAHVESLALRFRLTTLQSRYSTFTDLWDRGLRAREEGRPGPFTRTPAQPVTAVEVPPREKLVADRVVGVASFRDAALESDKLKALYDTLDQARRQTGEEPVPFARFTDLVRQQVTSFRQQGASEVAFRVSVKEGKVSLTARALKGAPK